MTAAKKLSGTAAFQPRARLLKLIGAELISDDVVAVTEFVKNAYDADASNVTIRFENVSDVGGTIIVSDDGHGMDRETLLRGWMEPAGSTKRGMTRKVSPQGRWMLGEKGLGRFAADKLGASLELISRRAGSPSEVRALFDWDSFESDTALLDEVKSHWEEREATALASHGTVLRIGDLRAEWTERMFRRLCTRLARLRPPFHGTRGFTINIESDEFPDYAGELRAGYLERAPYSVEARFDGEDTFELSLGAKEAEPIYWNGPELTCGPLTVRLHVFDLETESLSKVGPRMEVRAWLREWSGVSIYRDGFRVWPYGEPHDDWLRLDQRRVNNPVVKLSNNQVVGFVELSQELNPELRDQTNREGLIHNQALNDLRKVVLFVLQQVEQERQRIRHPAEQQRAVALANRAREKVDELEELKKLSTKLVGREGQRVAELVQLLDQKRRMELEARASMMRGYTALASKGQVISTVLPQLQNELQRLGDAALNGVKYVNGGEEPVGKGDISRLLSRITERLDLLSGLSGGSVTRRRTIDVVREVRDLLELLQPEFEQHGIEVLFDALAGDELFRAEVAPEAFRTALHAILANAMDWVPNRGERRIRLQISGTPQEVSVLVSDSGPGFTAVSAQRAFDPLFSLKDGGQGMGLPLAREVLELHRGTIEVVLDGRRAGGNVRFTVPRKKSRATMPEE